MGTPVETPVVTLVGHALVTLAGVFAWPDGSNCIGIWQNGKQHGIGTTTIAPVAGPVRPTRGGRTHPSTHGKFYQTSTAPDPSKKFNHNTSQCGFVVGVAESPTIRNDAVTPMDVQTSTQPRWLGHDVGHDGEWNRQRGIWHHVVGHDGDVKPCHGWSR